MIHGRLHRMLFELLWTPRQSQDCHLVAGKSRSDSLEPLVACLLKAVMVPDRQLGGATCSGKRFAMRGNVEG